MEYEMYLPYTILIEQKKKPTLFSNVLNSQLITIENSKNYLGYV